MSANSSSKADVSAYHVYHRCLHAAVARVVQGQAVVPAKCSSPSKSQHSAKVMDLRCLWPAGRRVKASLTLKLLLDEGIDYLFQGGNNTLSVDSKTPMRQKWVVASSEECISRLGPRATLPTGKDEQLQMSAYQLSVCPRAAGHETLLFIATPPGTQSYAGRPRSPTQRFLSPAQRLMDLIPVNTPIGIVDLKAYGKDENQETTLIPMATLSTRGVTRRRHGSFTQNTSVTRHLNTVRSSKTSLEQPAPWRSSVSVCPLSQRSSLLSSSATSDVTEEFNSEFNPCRSLKCHRTRIHKNLFVAISVQIAMRIFLCVDQYIARKTGGEVAGAASGSSGALYDTPVFCEILYSLLEYTKTVKFMWMFVEGLYLHNMIAVAFFSGKPNYVLFYSLGWDASKQDVVEASDAGTSLLTTLVFSQDVQKPDSQTLVPSVVLSIRPQAANAQSSQGAIILLPLLGLTNFVIMLEPVGDDNIQFSVWIFSAHFLTDFEGFFISLIYCFLNGEVQSAVKRHLFPHLSTTYSLDVSSTHWRNTTIKVRSAMTRQLERWRQHRLIHSSSLRRLSRSFSIFTSFTEVANPSQVLFSFLLVVSYYQLHANGQMVCTVEANGDPKNGGGTTNGQVPLLRSYKRRLHMRRSSTRDGVRRQCQASQPLRTETVQEQEI
ncbi:hypothetical protein C0Q70_10194 [Pomacea canaliculata]|uniref:G-protein coupled receptors family 2 profile 2 domain-containing protein n=1 Tax=Pomacea canaliculata TaxID=400727 RepID=A0A2T7PBX8_POMCA|nr:hypothetical protein C0Q70_10194 [Pomacea canaliculata]